jgi:hypothetical protein
LPALKNKVSGDFKFTIDADDSITYATAFNGKSIIRSLRIQSSSSSIVTDVLVEVSVHSLGKALSETWSARLGTLADQLVEFEDLNLEFHSDLLFQQTEAVPAELKIALKVEGDTKAEVLWSMTLHSPNTWMGLASSRELLAAFVQPNHPSLRPILDRAVKSLGSTGGVTALSGYQIPQHVRPMVAAIYQAMVEEAITYSDPPASWDLPDGQRIRSAQTVIEEKVGTCLDTAILFASLLEAAGLFPVVAVIPGHAFVGYWTAEYFSEHEKFPLWTQLQISEVINLIDNGYIELFETTTICVGLDQRPYQAAITETVARISATGALGINATKSSLVNVAACRMLLPRPIRPMPASYRKSDGTIQVVEYQPQEFTVSMLKDQLSAEGAQGSAAAKMSLSVPPVVKRWLNSLLDLSRRNPLINFNRPKSSIHLLVAPNALGVIEDLLQNGQTLTLQSVPISNADPDKTYHEILDARGESAKVRELTSFLAESLAKKVTFTNFGGDRHRSQLRKLASSAKTFLEETGSNGLYLALGTLSWTTMKKEKVRSPLILVPVNLIMKNRGREFFLEIDEGNQVMPNFSLAEKLLRDDGIKLENLVNLVEDESGIDIDGTFDYIRKTLAKAEMNDFHVDENAILGIFDFSTYRLWRDLLDNWKTFENNAVVRHFINTPNQEFQDPSTGPAGADLDDLVSRLPISSDASQAKAISWAMAGKTFILQGPPGTGKSQTITNLLARALSEGKRVLFVAQKKEALDVVKHRLDAAGLGAFTLDLHDKGLRPKAVKEQLAAVIDIAISADQVGYESARGEYEGALVPLRNYRDRLHAVGRLGESIYSALDKKLAVQGVKALKIPGEFIANSTIEMKEILHKSARAIAELGPQTGTASANPWSLANRTSDLSDVERAELKDLVRSVRDSLSEIEKHLDARTVLQRTRSMGELRRTKALTYPEADSLGSIEFTSQVSREAQRSASKSIETLRSALIGSGHDLTRLDSLDLDSWSVRAAEADSAFFLLRGMKQGGVLKKINAILGTPVITEKTNLVPALESLRSIKIKKNQAERDLERLPGFQLDLSENLYSLETLQSHDEMLARREDLTNYLAETDTEISSLTSLVTNSASGSLSALIKMGEEASRIFEILESDDASVDLWRGSAELGASLIESTPEWAADVLEHSFSQLTRWINLLREADPFKEMKLGTALNQLLTGEIHFIDAPNAFLNGYYETLMNNLVVETGFKTFEAATINKHINNLSDAHSEIRDRLPRVAGADLLNRRGFDSSMKVGAIGDLVAALKLPKSRTPIRTLLSKHWGVITKVTPCVLASPDSCVRFLDPDLPPFDLVVFDEASQIRVAHAIGAIGRSKAVIVVGDSKQMPPTSVAQVRMNDYEEDDSEELPEGLISYDMESILDYCDNARIPDIMLNWHYRSADESLIAFSNKKYYDGKLNSFPSPSDDKAFKGLSFEYVPGGQFMRPENEPEFKKTRKGNEPFPEGTNSAEIDAILKYLSLRLKDPMMRNDSIGIVTFNQKQKVEIEERLNNSTDPNIQKAMSEGVGGEEIFVKELEAVQGSERDVILFSVAFSKNLKGDLPLNFGPLTHAGGERRLNVAITRARKQVRVFCSFKPDELLNRRPSSLGVLHLAQFLKMANKEEEDLASIYVTRESHPDRMRRQILAALREAGLNAVEEVGLSDFKVDIAIYDPKDKSKAVLGILLDGPRWNSRETVSDRDCLSVSLLRDKMGWPAIERIWLASWLRNPTDEVQRIKGVYEEVMRTGAQPMKKPEKKVEVAPIFTTLDPEEVELGENPVDRLLREVPEWRPMYPSIIGDKKLLDYLYDQNIKNAISSIASQLTEFEGPVSPDRLAKFIASCFGLERVNANRSAAINSLQFNNQQRDEEGFLFPKGETYFTFSKWRHGADTPQRHILEISITEISNAMKAICAVAQGVRPEQLNKEVSRLFGVAKVSAAINQRLDAALTFGLNNGRLLQSGDYIQAL